MAHRLSGRAWVWFLGIAIVAIFLGHWCWSDYQSIVVLLPDGKAAFYRGAFFHRDKFNLSRRGTSWHFWNGEGGGELILPFECEYNEYRDLRLENNGKVYMIDRKEMTREELRVVDGEWSYNASDHWRSIFDLN